MRGKPNQRMHRTAGFGSEHDGCFIAVDGCGSPSIAVGEHPEFDERSRQRSAQRGRRRLSWSLRCVWSSGRCSCSAQFITARGFAEVWSGGGRKQARAAAGLRFSPTVVAAVPSIKCGLAAPLNSGVLAGSLVARHPHAGSHLQHERSGT